MDAPPLTAWHPREQYLDRPEMADGRFFYIVGPHGSGKSTLARRLMQYVDMNVGMWFAFCGSEGSRAVTEGLIPDVFCQYRPVAEEDIRRVMKACELERRRAEKAGRPQRRLGVLFDDCSKVPAMTSQRCPFISLVDNMRHLGCTIIMTVQNANYVHANALSQADFLFTMNVTMAGERKLLYDRFFRENLGTPTGTNFGLRDRQRLSAYLARYAPGPGSCLVFSRAGPKVVSYFRWRKRYPAMPLGDPEYIRQGRELSRAQPAEDPDEEFEELLGELARR